MSLFGGVTALLRPTSLLPRVGAAKGYEGHTTSPSGSSFQPHFAKAQSGLHFEALRRSLSELCRAK